MGTSAARGSGPIKLGLVPGDQVAFPTLRTIQGKELKLNAPTVVLFTWFNTSRGYHDMVIAEAWQRRYPNLQIVAAGTQSPEEVSSLVRRHGWQVPVVADPERQLVAAFELTMGGIVYLLDDAGIVRDKLVGRSYQRWLEFDAVLAWAASGEWERVRAQSMSPLLVGERPSFPLEALNNLLGERPLVVYHHLPGCEPCEHLHAEGLQEVLGRFAENHPEVHFIILQDVSSLNDLRPMIEAFVELYGEDSLPPNLLQVAQTDLSEDVGNIGASLYPDDLPPNVRLVNYFDGDTNDPARWWGRPFAPGIMVFDTEGRFVGPEPFWLGPYRLVIFKEDLEELLVKVVSTEDVTGRTGDQ